MVPDSIDCQVSQRVFTKRSVGESYRNWAKTPTLCRGSRISSSFGQKNLARPRAHPFGFFCALCYFCAQMVQGRVLGRPLPKHKVLRVSYCDSDVSSIVRCSWCIVNFLACVCSIGHNFSLINMKLSQNVCLDESRMSLKMGHMGSKTRSLGQILEKLCVCFRGQIFRPIIMKLGQNVCVDEISD